MSDNEEYIGRASERDEFRFLLDKRIAQLVTCQGRRRIGKSRFIKECASRATHYYSFSGVAPHDEITCEDQLNNFAQQLSRQFNLPLLQFDSWSDAFAMLARSLPPRGKLVLLLDEISWMALGDKNFAGYLKTAWDTHFSSRSHLILVLCGSVSSWIEQNILNSAGFVGRCSWTFRLGPLPISESTRFWGKRSEFLSLQERLDLISITGGVPGYLREIDPRLTAEKNIARLCYSPGGMLFKEFRRIFHDIFLRRAGSYAEIVETLVGGAKTIQQISRAMGRARGGTLADSLEELEQAGFLRKDISFNPSTGKEYPRKIRFRLADPYLRFYLKYIEPNYSRIEKKLYKRVPLESLEAWDTIMGLQFETLVLDSLPALYHRLGLDEVAILNAGPYFQTQTQRRKSCQVDILIRTKTALYLVEIKRRKTIPASTADEMKEKVKRLAAPKTIPSRTVLLYAGELAPALRREDYFDFIIPVTEIL